MVETLHSDPIQALEEHHGRLVPKDQRPYLDEYVVKITQGVPSLDVCAFSSGSDAERFATSLKDGIRFAGVTVLTTPERHVHNYDTVGRLVGCLGGREVSGFKPLSPNEHALIVGYATGEERVFAFKKIEDCINVESDIRALEIAGLSVSRSTQMRAAA